MVALGMALVYRANRIINFAQADLGLGPDRASAFLLLDRVGPALPAGRRWPAWRSPWPSAPRSSGWSSAASPVAPPAGHHRHHRPQPGAGGRGPRCCPGCGTSTGSVGPHRPAVRRHPPGRHHHLRRQRPAGASSSPRSRSPSSPCSCSAATSASPSGPAPTAPTGPSLLGVPVHRLQTLVWSVAAALAFVTVFLRSGILELPDAASALGLQRAAAGPGRPAARAASPTSRRSRRRRWPSASSSWASCGTTASRSIDPVLGVVVVVALLVRRRRGRPGRHRRRTRPGRRPTRSGRSRPSLAAAAGGAAGPLGRCSPLVAVVALGLPDVLGVDQVFKARTLLIYALLGLSLVLLSGWGGIVSLGPGRLLRHRGGRRRLRSCPRQGSTCSSRS